MPRATTIRGLPVASIAGQRQRMHQAQVQAAAVPVIVDGAVDAVATDLGASITTINNALLEVDLRLDNLENPEP